VALLLKDGIDYTCEYIAKLFNENISVFNELVKECSEECDVNFFDATYRIEKFRISDLNKLGINKLSINYDWSTIKNGLKEYYKCTHGLINIETNKIELFQFGPYIEANKRHREWFDNMLSREYKFKQLKITN